MIGFLAVWYNIHPFFDNPVLPHPLQKIHTHPKYPLRILSSEQSATGLVTVAEWLPPSNYREDEEVTHPLRYLRVSHSILGGVWMNENVETIGNVEPVRDLANNPLGDSVYPAFVLQEAGLLVNNTKSRNSDWKNALIM